VAQGGDGVAVACRAAGLSRRSFYRAPQQRDDTTVVDALQAVVAEHGRWGVWKCFRRLRLDGQNWNHERVLRVYRQLKLNLPRRIKKRLPQRERQTLVIDALPNRLWSIDLMSDVLYGGRRFRTFSVLDEGVREALAIESDTSLPSEHVVRVFEQLRQWRGLPIAIRRDNGPEFISRVGRLVPVTHRRIEAYPTWQAESERLH